MEYGVSYPSVKSLRAPFSVAFFHFLELESNSQPVALTVTFCVTALRLASFIDIENVIYKYILNKLFYLGTRMYGMITIKYYTKLYYRV